MSARLPHFLPDHQPANIRSPQGKTPASESGGAKSGAHTEGVGFPNTPIVVPHPRAVQGPEKPVTQKEVKNAGRSSEFIENKGAKKVLLRVY